jgi:hypothetical protein
MVWERQKRVNDSGEVFYFARGPASLTRLSPQGC